VNQHSTTQENQFSIDGRSIQSLEDFYRVIGEAVSGQGGYFGDNLDALSDCLRGGYGAELPCEFIWMHHEIARVSLGYQETVKQLEIRLRRCHPTNKGNVETDLEIARRDEGKTVFDWLVDIFDHAEGVTLVLR
jgi:RNAse (barnase) inhibitor barstar